MFWVTSVVLGLFIILFAALSIGIAQRHIETGIENAHKGAKGNIGENSFYIRQLT